MKRIHRAQNIAEIKRVVDAIDGEFRVNVFLTGGRTLASYPGLQGLQAHAAEIHDGSYRLYQIESDVFRKLAP